MHTTRIATLLLALSILSVATPVRGASRWCAEDLDALDDETCFAPPRPGAAHRSLLVFFHGLLPPGGRGPDAERVQRIAIQSARRAGFGALVPRGIPGIGPAALKGWYAWPTSSKDYRDHAPSILASLADKKRALEAIAGGTFAKTYFAGSSNGAYFVVALAMRNAVQADGWAATSGGAAQLGPRGAPPRAPFYVGFGTHDPSRADPQGLVGLLRSLGWPHRATTHPLSHGAAEAYLDDAVAFWKESLEPR